MISQFKIVKKYNFENLNEFFNKNIDKNWDLGLFDNIEINVNCFNIKKNEERVLFNHFLVLRTVNQITINLCRNMSFYADAEIKIKYIDTIEDEKDRNKYGKWLQKLMNINECDQNDLKKILKSSFIMSVIVFRILQDIEKSKELSSYSDNNITYSANFSNEGEITEVSKDNIKSLISLSKFGSIYMNENTGYHSLNLRNTWKCSYCENINIDEDICEVCEEKNPKKNSTFYTDDKTPNKYEGRDRDVKVMLNKGESKNTTNIEVNNRNDDKDTISHKIDIRKYTSVVNSKFNNHLKSSYIRESNGSQEESKRKSCSEIYDQGIDSCNRNEKKDVNAKKISQENDNNENKINLEVKRNKTSESKYSSSEDMKKIEDDPIPVRWTCEKCTMANLYDDDLCKTCNQHGPHYKKWRCEKCTFINDKLSWKCEACKENNSFIGTCSLCQNKDINTKYDKICELCKIKSDIDSAKLESPTHVEKFDHQINMADKWSCSKCSFLNSFDLFKCDVCDNDGPNLGKWRCEKCTMLNDNTLHFCTACESFNHLFKHNNNSSNSIKYCEFCKSLTFSEDRLCHTCHEKYYIYQKSTYEKRVEANPHICNCGGCNKYNHSSLLINANYDEVERSQCLPESKFDKLSSKRFCVHCCESLSFSDDQLCFKCSCIIYICPRFSCGKIVQKLKGKCDDCGLERYHNIENHVCQSESWICPWRACRHINDRGIYCKKCFSYREARDMYIKCFLCGYIGFYKRTCEKCEIRGSDYYR